MVALPLFKLAALLVRHVSKYGAVRLPLLLPSQDAQMRAPR
jgi:hypothetical protein